MSAASLRARYLGDAVATSSPQQVLVMLYDRLALDLERAQKAVAAGDRSEASEQLQHAQAIVLFVVVALLTLLIFRSSRRWVYYEGGER